MTKAEFIGHVTEVLNGCMREEAEVRLPVWMGLKLCEQGGCMQLGPGVQMSYPYHTRWKKS